MEAVEREEEFAGDAMRIIRSVTFANNVRVLYARRNI